jgi:glycosyltransferase involved in cell wall biosynthesis
VAAPDLRYEIPADLTALSALLGGLDLEAIEIQHFLHLDPRVIDAVRALPIAYDVIVHDYAWICPRVTLLDDSKRYCGEPAVAVCQTCVRRNGSNIGEAISVPALRARSATWLRAARRVIAPSRDTAERIKRHFDGLDVHVQPHAPPVAPAPLQPRRHAAKTVRVALMGAIGDHKGYSLLLKCARDARKRGLPLEFVVIGHTENDAPLVAIGNVFITGRYAESEAPHLIRRERPDVAWFASVWPETWCYTLDYALQAGVPVAAFDLGAIAERLRAAGTGTLLPLALEPRQINEQLLKIAGVAETFDVAALDSVKEPVSRERGEARVAAKESDDMAMPKSSDEQAQHMQVDGMSASVQVLPLPPGLYLFTVKSAGSPAPGSNGQLALPALHVGLGPGVRSEQVEFVAGPSTEGAWLFAQSDLLVTKIKGPGATLVLTSVRAPGGEALSIKVERLDARAEAAAPEARPVPAAAPISPPLAAGPSASEVKSSSKVPITATSSRSDTHPVSMLIQAHIRSRGDMSFSDVPWAGRLARGLWIESFSVRPLERLAAKDVEYKGLTGTGFETPWVTDDKMCGTKGMSVPLVGFAVRLKPGPEAAAYETEYSGYFQSGLTVGPLRNGAPCRSTLANDPLEGIQVRVLRRSSLQAGSGAAPPGTQISSAAAQTHAKAAAARKLPTGIAAKPKRRVLAPVKRRPGSIPAAGNASRSARSIRRHSTRRP